MQRQEKYLQEASRIDLGEGRDVKQSLKEGFLEEARNWDLENERQLDEQNLGREYDG